METMLNQWQGAQQWISRMGRMENPLAAPQPPVFQLTLRLTHMLEDTYRQLAAADHVAFKRQLVVRRFSNITEVFFSTCDASKGKKHVAKLVQFSTYLSLLLQPCFLF